MRRAGPPLAMIVLLPALTYYLGISLREGGGALLPPSLSLLGRIPPPTLTAVGLYAGWLALQLALYGALPSRRVDGARWPTARGSPTR